MGSKGLCGGDTGWLLAGSLGRRVELSGQSQEDRRPVCLWHLLLWVEFLTMAYKTLHNLEPSLTSLTALLCTQSFSYLQKNRYKESG